MSGWCQAASARWPTVLITISVPFQLLVLYFRRIQPPSSCQCGSSLLEPLLDLGVADRSVPSPFRHVHRPPVSCTRIGHRIPPAAYHNVGGARKRRKGSDCGKSRGPSVMAERVTVASQRVCIWAFSILTAGWAGGSAASGWRSTPRRPHDARAARRPRGRRPARASGAALFDTTARHLGAARGHQPDVTATRSRRMPGSAPAPSSRSPSPPRCAACMACPLDLEADALRARPRTALRHRHRACFSTAAWCVDGGRGAATAPPRSSPACRFRRAGASCSCSIRTRKALVRPRRGSGLPRPSAFRAGACGAHLCRLVLMQVLPAVAEGDLGALRRGRSPRSSACRRSFRAGAGRPRSPARVSPRRSTLLGADGADGLGQSSWGPTGFAFAATARTPTAWPRMAARTPAQGEA